MPMRDLEVLEELFDDKPAFKDYLRHEGITMYRVMRTDCILGIVRLEVA